MNWVKRNFWGLAIGAFLLYVIVGMKTKSAVIGPDAAMWERIRNAPVY